VPNGTTEQGCHSNKEVPAGTGHYNVNKEARRGRKPTRDRLVRTIKKADRVGHTPGQDRDRMPQRTGAELKGMEVEAKDNASKIEENWQGVPATCIDSNHEDRTPMEEDSDMDRKSE